MRHGVMLFKVALVVTIWLAGFGQAVLHLWNWLMPGLFGLREVTYWQAVGLMGLCWLLFSGPRGLMGMRGPHHAMNEEERQKLREGLRRWHKESAPPPVQG